MKQIEQNVFGPNKVHSMTSQYRACSFGQLRFRQVKGMNIKLKRKIASFASGSDVVNAAIPIIEKRKGVSDVSELADHVMFCVAPGAGSWLSTAGINWWSSQFNGKWALSLSAVMHEMGHNLGLIHSGLGDAQYGDLTDYMGFGYASSSWPQKCFNGVKNHQLGWYSSRELYLDPVTMGPRIVTLASFVDFPLAQTDEHVVINIVNLYYLQYNEAKGFNINTGAKVNQVTITKDSPLFSQSLAGLSWKQSYTIANFTTGNPSQHLVIEVCYQRNGTQGVADAMILSIALNRSICK